MWIPTHQFPSVAAAVLLALVLLPVITWIRPKGLGTFVSALLAIIPLIDLIVLAPISQAVGESPAIAPTLILAVPLSALLLALFLQRIAPAT
jgi:hypothetical protein